jgi:hypothetical protein
VSEFHAVLVSRQFVLIAHSFQHHEALVGSLLGNGFLEQLDNKGMVEVDSRKLSLVKFVSNLIAHLNLLLSPGSF